MHWRQNVPNFLTVDYTQVYSGIDVQYNVGTIGGAVPGFRAIVSPGADPKQLVMSVRTEQLLDWTVFPDEVVLWSEAFYTLNNLVAYQISDSTQTAIPVSFVQVNNNSFRPEVGAYDTSLPLIIEFGDAYISGLVQQNINVGYDNSVISSGYVFYGSPRNSFVGKSLPDGTPVFLSLFDEVQSDWLLSDQEGNITIAGAFGEKVLYVPSTPPVTADAPQSQFNPNSDGWLGRFDANGNLLSATYTGGSVNALALDPDGSAYFSTSGAVIKWVPGVSQFAFTAPVENVFALATNAAGELAFAATGAAALPTTAGAVKPTYEGLWTQYAGRLDPSSGAIQMATYAAITSPTTSFFQAETSLSLAPAGNLWLASDIFFTTYPNYATIRTLVAVSGDGTRMVDSESLFFFPNVAFDSDGNVLLAAITNYPNLETDPGAPLRVPCIQNPLYLEKKAADGSFISGTYVDVTGQILGFDGFDRVFINQNQNNFLQVNTALSDFPQIACVISPATKLPLYYLAPGELTTISGSQIGPLQQVTAAVDSNGNLPTQLAGVQVLINNVPKQMVSVQQGAITFYLPEDAATGAHALDIISDGTQIASTFTQVDSAPRFSLLTANGSGFGPAAALNQDGTLNSVNGAPAGSVVTIFGIGTTPPTSVMIGNNPAVVEYAGPAPGLPGVKQINVRIPAGPLYDLVNGFAQIAILPGPAGLSSTPPAVFIKISQ